MNRRKFLNVMGCGCSGLLINACSTTPITDRRQFKIIPEAKLNAQAAQIYEKVKEKEKCYYCDYTNGINGIDRCDSDKDYENNNVVSCCKYCNIMKNTKTYQTFEQTIKHLYNVLIDNKDPDYSNEKYFEISKEKTFNGYKLSSNTRHISFQIDIE